MSQEVPITPKGLAALKAELVRLKEQMPVIVDEIEVAREKGDLKENAEYHAAKEKQGQIYAKIKYLKSRIGRALVIDPSKLGGSHVCFGAIVDIFDVDTEEETRYQIVGEDEAVYKNGTIGVTSPLARALLGKQEGDETTFKTPKGKRTLEITEISFPES